MQSSTSPSGFQGSPVGAGRGRPAKFANKTAEEVLNPLGLTAVQDGIELIRKEFRGKPLDTALFGPDRALLKERLHHARNHATDIH